MRNRKNTNLLWFCRPLRGKQVPKSMTPSLPIPGGRCQTFFGGLPPSWNNLLFLQKDRRRQKRSRRHFWRHLNDAKMSCKQQFWIWMLEGKGVKYISGKLQTISWAARVCNHSAHFPLKMIKIRPFNDEIWTHESTWRGFFYVNGIWNAKTKLLICIVLTHSDLADSASINQIGRLNALT